jgi:hypothetical protein
VIKNALRGDVNRVSIAYSEREKTYKAAFGPLISLSGECLLTNKFAMQDRTERIFALLPGSTQAYWQLNYFGGKR